MALNPRLKIAGGIFLGILGALTMAGLFLFYTNPLLLLPLFLLGKNPSLESTPDFPFSPGSNNPPLLSSPSAPYPLPPTFSPPSEEKNTESPSATKTEGAIRAQYAPRFKALESLYTGKINALLAAALADYNRCQGNKVQLLALVPKYLHAGQALEAECDTSFNTLVSELEVTLKAHSLPLTLVQEARQNYAAQKNVQRQKIFNLARKAL